MTPMSPDQFVNGIKDLQDGLRRFLLALCCGNRQKADDLAQETLIKAYIGADSLQRADALKAWIYRIAYRTFINGERSVMTSLPLDEAREIAADTTADGDLRYQALHTALAGISPLERSAIVFFYFEGYSTREIAEMTSTSDDAVKQQLSRGRRHLRELLSQEL